MPPSPPDAIDDPEPAHGEPLPADTPAAPVSDRRAVNRTGLLLGLLVAFLMVAPLFVGSLLPSTYVGRATRRFPVSPERLWAAASDPVRHPVSGSVVTAVELAPPVGGLPAWREVMGETWMDAEVVAQDPPRSRRVELRDASQPWSTSWELVIEPEGEGSSATVVQTLHIEAGGLQTPLLRWTLFLSGADHPAEAFLALLARDVTP